MARGGSRPGAGRPRLTDEEKAARAAARKSAAKAKPKKKAPARKPAAKKVKASRVAHAPGGVKEPSAPERWPFGTGPASAPAPSKPADEPDPDADPVIAADSPLDFLLAVVRESKLKLNLRMQAAAIAAPFVHAKPAPKGKKEEAADAAKKIAGKFGRSAPPKLVVNNKA